MNEVDTYKIFRQLEERQKRRNPYSFYDKDELVDEILKNEDEIDRLNNIINELEKLLEYRYEEYKDTENNEIKAMAMECKNIFDYIQELKENNK